MGAEQLGDLEQEVLAGNPRALSRAATLVESESTEGRELIGTLSRNTGRAQTLGITGPPGSGKSTLVNQLIRALRSQSKTIGVIAVDPSSPLTQGAILGDRVRMQDHYADPGVFIRSMASRGKLGGLARSTREVVHLLDAAGKDFILIETVGVGQGEVEVARLAQITALVLVPGQGDDIQMIKAGIMEIADIFVINKADLPGADRLEQDIRAMQGHAANPHRVVSERAQRSAKQPLREAAPVCRTVATDGAGISELLDVISALGAERRSSDRIGS